MRFDPTLPANGVPLVSAEMRSQLNGLSMALAVFWRDKKRSDARHHSVG